jgi:hypothetical protein
MAKREKKYTARVKHIIAKIRLTGKNEAYIPTCATFPVTSFILFRFSFVHHIEL